MSKNLKVVVASSGFPESGMKILREHFQTVLQTKYENCGEEGLTKNLEELMTLVPGSSALVWLQHAPITAALLDKAGPQLKLVSTASAGFNQCNVEELKKRGIKLSNTPNVLSPAVADLAVSLMIAAARRFTENLVQVKEGVWNMKFFTGLGLDLRGSTVGIVGLGSIGQAIVKRLCGFEIRKFVYTGHKEKPEGKALNAEFLSLDDLLTQSDFVVLCVPLNSDTENMINKERLAKMKKTSIIVNIGRGEVIDQEALYDALKDKNIYAAALDVTTPEPLPKDHKLLKLPNVFIVPHIGSATERTRNEMAVLAANNVVNALNGKPLITPVLP